MQSSNLSFLTWYKTMFLLTATKKGFSSKEIQRQLGLKRYEPVWAMVHILRSAMGKRDDRYTLEGMIEMDEGYFTIETSESEDRTQKSGRVSKTKSFVYKLNRRHFGEKIFDRLVIANITGLLLKTDIK